MRHTKRRLAATGLALGVAGATIALTGGGAAAGHEGFRWTSVPAVADTRGVTAPNVLSPGFIEYAVAQGSMRLENPTADVPYYGYNGNGTLLPDPTLTQAPGHNVEASKTEGDKNTYLNLRGLHGADPNYRYGTHFLYQGHETGIAGYITRINLDADNAHRVTLLATKQADGTPIPTIDGSTWDPWAQRLLFTTESGGNASVMQATPDIGSTVEDVSFVTGRGGYEGIQNDSDGNLWIVEDVGGTTIPGTGAKNPNSFVYRLVLNDKRDIKKGGKLQALQVTSRRSGNPITFQPVDAAHPNGGVFTDDQKDISTYGPALKTRWVTVHDTAVDTSGKPFDANAAAKAAGATPLKRPENGVFRPGSNFREFYFSVTGDTNVNSTANPGFGGWGGAYRLTQSRPGADEGRLSLLYAGNKEHTGFDNVTFFDQDHVAFVEDASDGVHAARNAFDSGYLFDVRRDYAKGGDPVRFLAEGRDPSATLDGMLGALGNGFQNEGDNEITGIHVSDGDPTPGGILGAKVPRLFHDGWRLFWNQQHGDNVAWEIIPAPHND
jgi:hypothetical protein